MTEPGTLCTSCGRQSESLLERRLCPACLLQLALVEAEEDTEQAGLSGRYTLRAVIDDAPEATAYLAEDTTSRRLVRLEVAKLPGFVDSETFRVRLEATRWPPGAPGRVLDGGFTGDGRAWVVAEYLPDRATRGLCLRRLLEAG